MKYNIDNIVPVDDQILVQLDKPHKIIAVKKERKEEAIERERAFYQERTDKVKRGEEVGNEEFIYEPTDFDTVKVKVDAKYRTGVVLKTPVHTERDLITYEVGQRVIFENGNQVPLDLLSTKVGDEKCPVLIRKMHVKGVIVE